MRVVGLVVLALLPSCAALYDFEGDGGASGTSSTTVPTGAGQGSTGAGQGATCDRDAVCATGHCVNGVCCDTTCDGPCQRCSASGTCEPVMQGTECAPSSCDGGVFRLPSTCSPGGACITGEQVQCLQGCAGAVCAGCTPRSCGPNQYCPPQGGACLDLLAQGAPCVVDEACASQHCTDGVCCADACLGPCERCDAAGVCTLLLDGQDPDDECPDEPGCGRTGFCSGKGNCSLEPATSACSPRACVGIDLTPERLCDGMGNCAAPMTAPCPGNFTCADDGMTCRTSCTASSQCATGFVCRDMACVVPAPVGTACTLAEQCETGNCVDNFCCNGVCSGVCQACSSALTGQPNGTCSGVTAPVADPGCPMMPESTCGTTGFCQGGACETWPLGTLCGPISCSGSSVITPTCNAQGACIDGMFDCNNDVPGDVCCTPLGGGDPMCGNPSGPFCD